MVFLRGQAKLFQIVDALGPVGRLTRSLYGRQEQPDEHADDRDHDQQLDQCETCSRRSRFSWSEHGKHPIEPE
jgi:hypothetical protein